MVNSYDKDDLAEKMLAAILETVGETPGKTASMWPIGEKLGLDRSHTEDVAMDLVAEGLLEIKSLSGGLALTEEGRARLKASGGSAAGSLAPDLSGFLDALEEALPGLKLSQQTADNLKIDIQILRLQAQRNPSLPVLSRIVLQTAAETLQEADSPLANTALKLAE